jgi:hypothetical protein
MEYLAPLIRSLCTRICPVFLNKSLDCFHNLPEEMPKTGRLYA